MLGRITNIGIVTKIAKGRESGCGMSIETNSTETKSTETKSVKQKILDAGVALLYEQGIASLTQPRIAKAAGVRQSHITYYFPTRNVLVLSIAEHSIDRLLNQILAPDASRTPADRIADQILNSPQLRVMLGLLVRADVDPELRGSLSEFIARTRERIAYVLEMHGLPHTPQHALILHATMVGLGMLNMARQTEASEAELRNGLAGLLAQFRALDKEGKDR